MENKKDIGKAIHDKLELLDKSPQDRVWGGINEELQKRKKKRRIGFIFFWGKTLGILLVAAIAAFYLYDLNGGSNGIISNSSKESIDVSTDSGKNKTNIDITGNSNSALDPNTSSNNSKISNEDQNASGNITSSNNNEETSTQKNNIISKGSRKNENSISNKTKEGKSLTGNSNNGSRISSKPKNYLPSLASKSKLKKTKGKITQKEKIYRSKKSQENIISTIIEKQKKKETEVDLSSLQGKSNSEIASEEKEKTKKKDSVAKKENDKEITINMFPEDSLKKDNSGKFQKFYLDAFISPTVYGTFAKRSLLDQTLDSLPKKSEIKFSYGFGISYDLSKRLSVRIGFQRINISYMTKNAFLSQSEIQILNYEGINYNTNISNETIYNASGIDPNQSFKMDISQKFTYTEIPLELKYKFLDRKLALKSSFGFSYLMLNENSISVKTINGYQQQIGKTKEMSSTAFSLNMGLELEYPIFKNTSIFMEPMFNYMVKAASAGSYNPYILGLHTGIRISFNN